jgi:RNA polymerase sigma-70 factor (ECF subfamily)
MADPLNDSFLQQINQNQGIAHKVARLYFTERDDREDVLQEMMYQLWRSYNGFDGRSKFSTWMYSVCLNTALTYKRNDKKKKNESLSHTHYQIANPPTENKDSAIELLFEVIAGLSPLNKAIVLLHLEKMTYEEIAVITGVTKSNVSVRLVRIKKELEIEMRKKIKSKEDVNF